MCVAHALRCTLREAKAMTDWRYRLRGVLAYYVRTESYGDPSLARRAADVLGAEERVTHQRIRSVAARRDYLAAHVLVRTMFSDLLGGDPARIRFRAAPGGRPELVRPLPVPRLRFSLCHADGVALCAVTAGRTVGADVESVNSVGPDPFSVAETICSPAELETLSGIPAAEQADHVLSLWTEQK